MSAVIQNFFLTNRFFWGLGGLSLLFAISFAVPVLFSVTQALLVVLGVLVSLDTWSLFGRSTRVRTRRRVPQVFNLGDLNNIRLELHNRSPFWLKVTLYESLPVQLQIRDFSRHFALERDEKTTISYEVHPLERGVYTFGDTVLFLSTRLGLVQRRFRSNYKQEVPVYPSIQQMKQIELRAFNLLNNFQGIKKVRRIGHSYEFDQIKNYVPGDDYRSINWKASSRTGELMVNQYEDERSQQVYSVIDKSRVMRMPFEGLSLLDYAINATLALSNIVLRKHDRAGLISFSDVIGTSVKADSRPGQLQKILQALYSERQRSQEANFELLYYAATKLIQGRSLILLYTNFESNYALERVLPILRRIHARHLLVIVFFKNTEIAAFAEKPVLNVKGIYDQTMARQFVEEKQQMVQTLQRYGIQAVLTDPKELSVNTVNKYLELKSRGLI